MGDLTRVTIDFDTSHLVFPIITGVLLAVLGLAVLVRDRRAIATSGAYWRGIFAGMDHLRFWGTIVLTLVYFLLMVPVGDVWPNTGAGFLICSIPYVFLIGVLYLHDRRPRALLPVAITSLIVPTLSWWLFTDLFFLTLP